jgi:hypothetical protein
LHAPTASATISRTSGEAIVYRQRISQEVLHGQFREYRQIADEVIARRKELGLAVPVLWAPTFGAANEVVWEIDYPDLASFERENDAFYADGQAMEQWRRLWQLVVQSSTNDELLQQAPRIA